MNGNNIRAVTPAITGGHTVVIKVPGTGPASRSHIYSDTVLVSGYSITGAGSIFNAILLPYADRGGAELIAGGGRINSEAAGILFDSFNVALDESGKTTIYTLKVKSSICVWFEFTCGITTITVS